ncbi:MULTISPECIES: hypothetical protein [Okeania]|nr:MULTISPECIES: hypothetical protein [Okeania]NES79154.1 hypothetical protein [Okeania sp. SIO1H4]NES90501.1 hypothetical protein [Okeania sp. SIO2B9]NET23348.1 hypothetical protein [Okeania sp. SIO1H5]NET79590.1 hypothetical protein [Okeania sp. SIO1F9]NET96253.1 hypothetical protein [Okeania sp. SIO1H2]
MNKPLFLLNKLMIILALPIILVSLVGFNNKTQAQTEEKRAACVLVDFDGRIRASGPCDVKITKSNTGVEFDIEWDGSTKTQFSMRKFPTDGTYSVEISNGGRASMKVEKEGSVFILRSSSGFRGRVIFP